ncbi:MAG: prolyl oligopeptidase family serine peptidase [Bacteroidota bacterium]|nr:prolyl oligopeptidase family serine peptidase [Bacteroidota bacterium]MDP4191454.1 prolyl oligopeptidase family serine peptidase [Bacteroidota bacterium]MDP4194459.1 prolyl oligopeptidase family serine peptidase [Bacteroidota bacterium]
MKSRQLPKHFTTEIKTQITLDYLLYLPEGYSKTGKKWPLVLFLHGAGERGSDLSYVKRHGPPKLVEQGKSFPFILVSPQCPDDSVWYTNILGSLLDEIEKKYNVDKEREYVTGLSMGGNGTWKMAERYPNRFAAIAPVCGWSNLETVCKLKHIPIWVFHGKKDRIVPFEKSEVLVKALKKCGGNIQFTVYPNAAHDSWTETYNNQEFYDWMLKNSLDRKEGKDNTSSLTQR